MKDLKKWGVRMGINKELANLIKEHDKKIRDKAIEEFCDFIHSKAKENNGLRLSSEARSWTHASIYYYLNEFKEKQMKEGLDE